MNPKRLLLELVKAKNEKQVDHIIAKHPILSDENNWRPLNREKSNLGRIHGQQANPIPALVEKPINSIDAILMKECRLKGIEPESKEAPTTIEEAVEEFFGVKRGDFSEISETRRREIAEDIQIIAEGSKQNPNIIIYDDGEGQHPNDFENTLLSLGKENKIKVKFVQGKYGMGGGGALPYCGTKKYQLIVSRRHPRLLNGRPDLSGFALVRYHKVETIGEYKMSWFEYSVDAEGKVFSFPAEELDLGLFRRRFGSGTHIKLFNYDLTRPSDITLDLWRDLNRYLYHPCLPVLLYEKRAYKGKTPTKLLLGNKMRILIDEREKKETSFPISINFEDVKCPGEITIFKTGVDREEFVGRLAVVFTIAGQVHNHLTNHFITSSARLPYLTGCLLVNIDCTNIPTSTRDELFMASRDRMRENRISQMLKDRIAQELRDHDTLRQINDRRRDEKVFRNPMDESFMEKVMKRLISRDQEISKLLGLNGSIAGAIKKMIGKRSEKPGSCFAGKRFPSYVRFKKITPGNIKMLPLGGECKLELETDVEDEYLIRPRDRGELKIRFMTPTIRKGEGKVGAGVSDEEVFDVNIVGPSQGEIKIRIKDKKKTKVGEMIKVNVELSSPDGPHTLSASIKIDNPKKKAKEKKVETSITHSLPRPIEVYRERKHGIEVTTWDDDGYKWCGLDICKVFPSGDEGRLVDAVAINMDADVIHDFIRRRKLRDKNIERVKRLFKVGIYLISLILYFELSQRKEIEEAEQFLAYLMKGVGKIILPIVINEEIIKEIELAE